MISPANHQMRVASSGLRSDDSVLRTWSIKLTSGITDYQMRVISPTYDNSVWHSPSSPNDSLYRHRGRVLPNKLPPPGCCEQEFGGWPHRHVRDIDHRPFACVLSCSSTYALFPCIQVTLSHTPRVCTSLWSYPARHKAHNTAYSSINVHVFAESFTQCLVIKVHPMYRNMEKHFILLFLVLIT